jgi:parallel beta-helix repeat protein
MKKKMMKVMCSLVLGGVFFCFLPSAGFGQPCNAVVGGISYPSINAAVNVANPFATINVSGTCNELVQILANKNHVTLNGGGGATIICQPPNVCGTSPNVLVLGKSIFITGFNITGGIAGVQVVQGGSATINGNTIYGTGRQGIVVASSYATIVNNTIHDTGVNLEFTGRGGIVVADNGTAYIGIGTPTDTVARPNLIRDNPNGIIVTRSASARIVGNNISNNTDNGIMVIRASQADITDNLLDGNGQSGIFVSQGSGVNLGNDIGTTIFDLPNSGTNEDNGLSCSVGGYVDGLLGTLDGLHGAVGISKGCFNSVTK